VAKQAIYYHTMELRCREAPALGGAVKRIAYNIPMDIEAIIVGASYAGIFALMIANGFFSFPSSQLLYIIVGYFVGIGTLALIPASLAGALGNTIGNVLLYEAIREHGVRYLKKFQLFREEDIRKVEIVFRKKGLWFLFVGKLLPAIKVFIPIPAALGKVHRGVFAALMLAASWVWSFIFIGIGYFFGKSAELWKSYGIILMLVALVIMYVFYRMLNGEEVLREIAEEKQAKD
jgi:membrane protein DedA with SNARE-associated domain